MISTEAEKLIGRWAERHRAIKSLVEVLGLDVKKGVVKMFSYP